MATRRVSFRYVSEMALPDSGWSLVAVDDLGRATHECDYCHTEHVRYVHRLTHPAHAAIRVGCVCAGKLTADPLAAQARENEARNRSKRLQTWCESEEWAVEADRQTRAGRHVHWDYTVMVYRTTAGTWRWILLYSAGKFISPEAFATAEEAKGHFWRTQLDDET